MCILWYVWTQYGRGKNKTLSLLNIWIHEYKQLSYCRGAYWIYWSLRIYGATVADVYIPSLILLWSKTLVSRSFVATQAGVVYFVCNGLVACNRSATVVAWQVQCCKLQWGDYLGMSVSTPRCMTDIRRWKKTTKLTSEIFLLHWCDSWAKDIHCVRSDQNEFISILSFFASVFPPQLCCCWEEGRGVWGTNIHETRLHQSFCSLSTLLFCMFWIVGSLWFCLL